VLPADACQYESLDQIDERQVAALAVGDGGDGAERGLPAASPMV